MIFIMKKNILLLFVLFFSCSSNEIVHAQPNNKSFSIYLVRHSEKDLSSKNYTDLPLSKCGEIRSNFLSKFLSDINLDVIYSTNYTRTINTALPTANSKKLKITKYSIENLKDFSHNLLDLKQNALVVGHSNTTGVLAGLLTKSNIGVFDENEYDRIYQVIVDDNGTKLQLFHSMFDCKQ